MTHRLIKDGELCLYGPVGMRDWFDEGFTATDVLQALTEMEGDITIRLNSPGGFAFDGIAIYNAIKARDGKTTMVVDGIAASAASVIAMAGDSVVMPEGSVMMIHDASGITLGTARDHRKGADVLDKLDGELARIYAKRTGIEAKAIRKMMDEETWLNGEEAVEKGFATQAGDATAQTPAAWNYKVYRNAPERLAAMATEWATVRQIMANAQRAALPASSQPKETKMADEKGGQNKSADLKSVSLDQIRAERPDLVTAIAADAVKAERERILDIENSTPPGYDEIVAKAKADGKSTAADVALAIVREQKAKGVKVIENLAADEKAVKGLRSEPANGEGEKPVAPAAATDEAGWKKEFTASEALQGEFRTVEAYVAFKKAKAEGRVRILTGKAAK